MNSDQQKQNTENTDSRQRQVAVDNHQQESHDGSTTSSTESRGNDDNNNTETKKSGDTKQTKNEKESPPDRTVQSQVDNSNDDEHDDREDKKDQHHHLPTAVPRKGNPQTSPPQAGVPSHDANTNAMKLAPKKGVPHVYRDFSNVPDAVGVVRKKTGGVAQPFPEKLHAMLNAEDDLSVVSWLPHGRAFIVRKPAPFTDNIMPKYVQLLFSNSLERLIVFGVKKDALYETYIDFALALFLSFFLRRYFRQTKLTSFQRQLNLYGFRRLTQGADAGAYYHELFLRGRPQLCLRMQRQKVKGTGHKQPADVQTEPNFYSMSPSKASDSQPPTPLQSAEQHSSPPASLTASMAAGKEQTRPGNSYDEMSPGLRGLHGAAQLLKGLASGGKPSSFEMPFSLGQSAAQAAAAATSSSTNVSSARQASSTLLTGSQSLSSSLPAMTTDVFAPPHQSGTLSLLGRVTNIDENLSQQNATPSAFFWPPRQKGAASTLIHPSPRLQASTDSNPQKKEEHPQVTKSTASTNQVNEGENNSPDEKTDKRTSEDQTEKQSLDTHPPLIPESTPIMKEDNTTPDPVTEDHDSGDESKMARQSRDTGLEGKTYEKSKLSNVPLGNKVTKGIETEEE